MSTQLQLRLAVICALCTLAHAATNEPRRALVESSITYAADTTGISRGQSISTSTTWNTFCEFILPFLLERGYTPPAHVCN
ncbi:predicted protein [Ostreococcus lucimarinus CCE9901]|uniref:Uncharacterized protein n=1 Tax=Ostreococcus lucimarinus (strain CCE9901) TaxID=436017 RepID=A4S0F5_OSTLU|nr:predicted protein [Ostreococcus lucimarinus CCE9901]ABO97256.1 predicted protein [Ostreococcus lucimarinus CCE9901]|eukprot:XP_001418963.1 predicted protein [Ostreococcus lucimarinus CCE9901]